MDKQVEQGGNRDSVGRTGFVKRGGFWVVFQAMLLFCTIASALTWHSQWQSACTNWIGTFFAGAAIVCGLSGAIALGRNLTPYPQPTANTRLVQFGIYAWIRHPLYTAVACGAVGWALFWRSWPALACAAALAWFFDAKARREERWLRQQFPEYTAYERRVRRFIPWIY